MNQICPICQQPVDPATAHAWYRWRFTVDDAGHEEYVRDAEPEDYTHRGECTYRAKQRMQATGETVFLNDDD